MTNKILLPLDKYPTLDLHGETRDMVYALLKPFLLEHVKLKHSVVVIVHGKSSSILKREVHFHLEKMSEVICFYVDNWNNGVTIVELKI